MVKRMCIYAGSFCMCILLCLLIVSCGKEPETEKEKAKVILEGSSAEYAEDMFLQYDEDSRMNSLEHYTWTGFDIREMGEQIDCYWDYYAKYEEEMENLQFLIETWEADFIPDGTYIIGKDLPEGEYLFCNPKGDEVDDSDAVAYRTDHIYDKDIKDIYRAPYFEVFHCAKGEMIKVRGKPKFASWEKFLHFTAAADGNYYGLIYRIGEDIPEGDYFVLSMDILDGRLRYFKWHDKVDWKQDQYAPSRFEYVSLEEPGEFFEMDRCMLIPVVHKPDILPILHENIGWQKERRSLWDILWNKEREYGGDYELPIYAEGGYVIGTDIPVGVYGIQNENTYSANDMNESSPHSRYLVPGADGRGVYGWTGLMIPEQEMSDRIGWKYMRTSIAEYDRQYVEIQKPDGSAEYWKINTKNGAMPEVVFDESDAGCVVRLVRCLLIPKELWKEKKR